MFYQSIIKSICWTTFFLFFQLALLAQQETYPCAASEMQRLRFEKDPTLLQRQLALDQTIHQHIQRQNAQPELRNSAVFTIPVVVHIIHQNGSENISDALVQSAIQHLNDAFAHQGYYGTAGKGTNIPIQFCLAQRNPNNQATNGITRDVSGLTTLEMETDDAALKNLNRWDPRQYVNIWVVRDINSKAHGSGVAGYAYYASAHGASFDGIVCEARYFGNTPENDVVLIHEVGHYLNLYHTFEGGCTNNNCELEGDRVCDTPPDQAKHTGCVYNSCNTDTDDTRAVNPLKADVNDLTENYLDYSPFSCQHAFTPGQSVRMLAALQTVRASLLDSPGCLPPCTQPIAADMVVPSNLVVGTPVTFTFNGSGATRYEWKLNGTVFSSQQNPSYTFTQAGIFTLEVIARNGDLNCWSKKQIPINVLCNAAADFTPKLMVVQRGSSLTFTSTSTGANQYEWSVNGAIVGAGTTYSHTFGTDGDYAIQLKASNASCSSISIGRVVVNRPCRGDTAGQDFPCPEICDNDIDDNGDGLVDCADPTCKCEECRQLPDGVITALDSIQCLGDSLKVYLNVCNKGRGVLRSSTPIAFYKTDPTNSNATPLAGLKTLGINLLPDSCTSRSFVIKAPGNNPIFVVLNDDYRRPRPYVLERYLSEQYPECNYRNNRFQFTYNSPQTPKLDLGPDQLTCANSVTLLRVPAGFARYRWFDGSTDSTFTAFSPGTYWVDVWDACGNQYSDSIQLKLQALGDVELGADRNICAGDTLHLSIAGFTQLKWWPATGLNCDTCKSIIAKPDTTTRYYMTARRGNCFAGDSVLITVNAQPKVDLGPDRAFCSDTTWQLIGPLVPSLSYRWNTGATTPSINVNQTGAYALEVRNAAGCNARDTAKLTFISNFSFDLGMDTTLCTGKSIRLPLKSIDATAYRWSTGEQSASIEIREPGLYILEGTKDNCSWRDSINITLEDCNRFAVYVPNVMSTTSAVNAQFHPFFSTQTELVTYQFDIFDRWGEMVFRSQDAQQSWDGTKNGQWCNQGVYVWTLRARYRENGQEKEVFKVGEVLLLR